MKFIIITNYGSHIVEANDFEDALGQAYDSCNGYDDVCGIVKVPEDDYKSENI